MKGLAVLFVIGAVGFTWLAVGSEVHVISCSKEIYRAGENGPFADLSRLCRVYAETHALFDEGQTEFYYENGQKMFRALHVNGKLEGEITFWNQDGRLRIWGEACGGKFCGHWVLFSRDSSFEGEVQNGAPVGIWIAQSEDLPVSCRMDVATGAFDCYRPDGRQIAKLNVDLDGKMSGEAVMPDGHKVRIKDGEVEP